MYEILGFISNHCLSLQSNRLAMRVFISSVLFLMFANLNAQRYLQLETVNDPYAIKYVENQHITYMSKTLNEWQNRKIERLMVPDSLVLFYDGFMRLEDFAAVQTKRPAIGAASLTLGTFGAGWLAFAIVDELYQPGKQIDAQTLAIGGTGLVLGYTLRKFFFKRTHKLGQRYRLRLLDLSIR